MVVVRVVMVCLVAAVFHAKGAVFQCVLHFLIIFHLSEMHVVDGLGGIILHQLEHYTVVKVLVEVFSIPEGFIADRAISAGLVYTHLSGGIRPVTRLVWLPLHYPMDGDKVAFEHIDPIEVLFCWCPIAWTKVTHHVVLVVGQEVTIHVIFPGEPPGVVLAR